MNERLPYDKAYLMIALALISIGGLMILSTSSVVGLANYQDSYFFIKRHLLYLGIGAFGLYIGMKIPFRLVQKNIMTGYFAACALVLMTFLPGIGIKIGGASRWISTGLINIQPVEVLKFFLIIAVSQVLFHKQTKRETFINGTLPCLIIMGVPLVMLLLQPDLGNSILLTVIVLVLLYLAYVPLRHIWATIGGGALFLTAYIFSNPYQMSRVTTFLFPSKDPLGQSYHVLQSFTAIGSGGITGLGLGQSKLKYFYIPFHYSDFIYSIICEEGGLLLGGTVLALYVVLFMRGMKIARQQPNSFRRLVVIGLNACLVFQAWINIAVVIGMLPVTGIPLTFISFGGTSLITSMFFVGIILNLSRVEPKSG